MDDGRDYQPSSQTRSATIRIARAIASENGDYRRTLAAAGEAAAILKEGVEEGMCPSEKERQWLDRIQEAIRRMPVDEALAIEAGREAYGGLFEPASYGFAA